VKIHCFVFFFLIFSQALQANPAFQALEKFKTSYAKVQDFQCILTKQVTKNGKTFPEATLMFKFKKPFSIYLEFLNPHEGRKAVFVWGKNKNQLLVEPDGVLGFMTLKLDPFGDRAMEEEISPITHLPFHYLIETVETWLTASQNPDQKVELNFEAGVDENQKSYEMIYLKDLKTGDFLKLYLSRDNFLPLKLQYAVGKNSARVSFQNFRLNTGLKEEGFEL